MATDDGTPTGIQYDDPMDRFSSPEDIVRRMRNDTIKKQQDYNDLIKQAATRNTSITPTQGFALTALAALPLIAGKFLSGRTRGATALDAGALGQQAVSGYAGQIEADDELRRQGLEQQARTAAGDLNIARSQEAALPGMFLRNKFEEEQRKRQHGDRLAEIEAKAAADRPDPREQGAYQDLLNAAMSGSELDPEKVRTVAAGRGGVNAINTLSTIQERSRKASNDQSEFDAETTLPTGFEWATPEKKSRKIAAEAKDFAEGEFLYRRASQTIKEGLEEENPTKVQIGRTDLFNAKDKFVKAGAALTGVEVDKKFADIPIDEADIRSRMRDAAFGRSVLVRLSEGLKSLDGQREIFVRARPGLKSLQPAAPAQGQPGGDVDTSSPEYQALVNENIEKIKAARAAQRQGR